MAIEDAELTGSPFLRDLGVARRDGEIVLTVTEPHTASGALHGGAIAALAMVSAQSTLRAEDGQLAPYTTSLHVTYARAGRGTTFTAASSTVRRARELGFYQTEVRDEHGAVIAGASSTLSTGRHGDAAVMTAAEPSAPLPGDPAEFERATQAIPFHAGRGLRVHGIDHGAVEIGMATAERNLDGTGRIHEGALLTLIDLAGTSAPWTLPRPSSSGATIALHAHILGPPPGGPVVARARVRAHDERVFWCDVTVSTAADRRLCALGHLTYRFS
ncbi:uncharacterized domain 1-containing protein [Amycolatopsis arida]|uniref:Uncharacterized domain 1-containing protein n=1 Tax=Amycolatopsis arida TaxID=587909 RepID=A0A1I5MFK0_9PSEU|nr:PaaI family thioesterase [Amycolatopsis arida]TDX94078.1 uncharacterized protein (TIGR00369 family) [Amycolatopsis arida]SFP08362.1 uncharacterized domain 1-containing protein [Amycolatopsis arida]